MEMAYKYREELVGKRFLSVSGVSKLNVTKISDWGWKAGVIRAASHKDNKNKDLQVLVEYDGEGWRRRQWLSVYGGTFGAFLVEQELVWAPRGPKGAQTFPALTFIALKSVTLGTRKPVEFLVDHELSFVDDSDLQPFKDWECGGEAGQAARRWARRQQAQRVLARSPAALGGCRAQVYRARGATQWYTAVIVGCNQETGELTLTDDTVLEEHNEDPALVQMRLLGDGVVESIMRGESVGIMPRRSRSGAVTAKKSDQARVSNRSTARAKKAGALLPAVIQNDKGSKKTTKKRKTKVVKLKNNVKKVFIDRPPKKEDIENKKKKKGEGSFISKKKVLEEVNKLREPEEEAFIEGDSSNSEVIVEPVLIVESELIEPEVRVVVEPEGEVEELQLQPVSPSVVETCPSPSVPELPAVPSLPSLTPGPPLPAPTAATGALDDAARMEEAGRFPDDRSDSGVSSLRSASGDERSGSRSSALSVPEEHELAARGMAHPAAPAPAARPAPPHLHAQHAQHAQHAHMHYPPPLLHLPPPEMYAPTTDLLWSKRYQEEYLERERHERVLQRSQQYLRTTPEAEQLALSAGQPSQRLLAWHRERRDLELADMKEREKEREQQERERQERERQEKAVHKHFEDSLRLANQKRDRTMSWSLINSLAPPGRGGPGPGPVAPQQQQQPGPEDHRAALNSDRLRGGQDLRERTYYTQAPIQRPTSVPKNDYPPPAHNRLSLNPNKPLEKPLVHVSLPKGEPNFNMYNYTGYHHPSGFINHDSNKQKSEHLKQVQMHGNITVTKAPSIQERDRDNNSLPTPPPLMSEMKNSVIVKHEGKIPQHHLEVKAHPAHSPKLRGGEMVHYLPVSQAPPNSYRGVPAPQRGRPHHQLPHANMHPQAHPPARPPLPYAYHQPPVAPPPVPNKPKVSSPAPLHIYGKPNAGITSGIPVCRSQEPPVAVNAIPLTSKANTAPCAYSVARPPPPAHSRGDHRPLHMSQASPPSAHPAPQPHAYQTQPLDLGISSDRDDSNCSPKRRGTPIQNLCDSPSMDNKKRRLESVGPPYQMESIHQYPPVNTSPLLSRVSEPTPLIASAATTITTMVNTAAYCTSPAPRTQTDSPVRIPSADGAVRPPSVPRIIEKTEIEVQPSPSPSPLPPVTPAKAPSPSAAGSPKESGAPVRHLKKAWLQRHETAPEAEKESTPVIATLAPTPPPAVVAPVVVAPVVVAPAALPYSIGSSMAVNSIIRTKPAKVARKSLKETNGHAEDPRKVEDSSSSDQERGAKNPPKRKPPKVKRKKGGAPRKTLVDQIKKKKVLAPSESGSDSEKEKDTNSDKDSDSGASLNHIVSVKSRAANGGGGGGTTKQSKDKEPRKRGRRPKSSKSDKNTDDEPIKKKPKDEPPNPPFSKPTKGQLKKTGESFLQDGDCIEIAPKLPKCRECRWTPHQRSKKSPKIFCRFYAFRRLRYTKNGQLAIAGFSDPNKDPTEEDRKLWLQASGDVELDIEMSCFLLRQVGDQFCELLQQENETKSYNLNEDKTIAWKRVVQGVREMCDVCETTLFNFHWGCGKCGFAACLDCYKSRTGSSAPAVPTASGAAARERDAYGWVACTSRASHEPARLQLTQIAAGDSLVRTGRSMHAARTLWGVPRSCGCAPGTPPSPALSRACRKMLKEVVLGKIQKTEEGEDKADALTNGSPTNGNNMGSWMADFALVKGEKGSDNASSSDSEAEGNFSTLRELLIRPNKPSSGNTSPTSTNGTAKASKKSRLESHVDDVVSSFIDNEDKDNNEIDDKPYELKHFISRYRRPNASGRVQLPIRIMTLIESRTQFPDVPHSWLCDGKLLRLLDPVHPGNYRIFQEQWKRGQPVIVSNVLELMDKDLWSPESFSRDFGEEKNDLINCITGNTVPNQPMKKFWDGFDQTTKRLKDEHGEAMLLKLKDWPPGEDFAEMLPTRFADLTKALPLQEYTQRNGRLNLAARLPDCFVRPDLGPKMYTAYGSALYPSHGTTNLHLDVSDAVNVMVYVSGPKDAGERATREAFRAIDEAGCDILTRRRVRERGELPGALWHIYNPRDADKIRDLLNKSAIERGAHPPPHHDPIHDQSCYLDAALRERLYKEYRVEGYAVAQCLGDAVFIPAGAPHQVRNLHDCIKVAEDFVSPENVSHCFNLMQEFRDLTDTHTNHEDKLQIKNIVYHAVKDSLYCLKMAAASVENLEEVDSKDNIKKEALP